MASPVQPISRNLRQKRQRRGLSLSDVAKTASISKSTLSELERGRGNPSIDTLWSLAQALNVPFAELFEDGSGETSRVRRRAEAPVVAWEGKGFTTRHLFDAAGGRAEVYLLELARGTRRHAPGHGAHVTEHVVVMSGRALVGPEDDAGELEQGDSITFSGDLPHVYGSIGGGCTLLAIHEYPAREA